MNKNQTDRLSQQHKLSKGVEGIFCKEAQEHDNSVKNVSKLVFKSLNKRLPELEFRYREKIGRACPRNGHLKFPGKDSL